jgi:hypothetical protein
MQERQLLDFYLLLTVIIQFSTLLGGQVGLDLMFKEIFKQEKMAIHL